MSEALWRSHPACSSRKARLEAFAQVPGEDKSVQHAAQDQAFWTSGRQDSGMHACKLRKQIAMGFGTAHVGPQSVASPHVAANANALQKFLEGVAEGPMPKVMTQPCVGHSSRNQSG